MMALAFVAAAIGPAGRALRAIDTTTQRFAAPLIDQLVDVPAHFRNR